MFYMDFFKKLFGTAKDGAKKDSSATETFICENCGQKRPISQKKKHIADEINISKKICEFC